MSEFRNRLANWLTAIGWIAAFTAVMPYFEYRGGTTANAAMMQHLQEHPDHMPYTETYRFGWTFSPLVEYRSARELVVSADGGFSMKQSAQTHVGFVSWSALSIVGGIVLIALARKLRSRPAANHVS